jgi:neutral ceramidase
MFRWAALALAAVSLTWAGELRVGRGLAKITPPVGIPMAGYYAIRLADGTHDDLFAKAIVLEKDGALAALVACDLLGIDASTVEEARALAAKLTPVPAVNIMVSATHTHTGPMLDARMLAAADPQARKIADQYRTALPARIAESVRAAYAALTPARVLTASGQETSISFYRRFLMKDGTVRTNPGKMNPDIVQPMGEIDPGVDLVWFDSPSEQRPLAAYLNFALHLDTVGGTQFSADYPYIVSKIMSKLHGPDLLTVFTLGAAGNINHVDVKSREPQKGHGEAHRIGTILAGETIKTLARVRPVDASCLRVARETVSLPVRRYTAAEIQKAQEVAASFSKTSTTTPELVNAFKVLDAAAYKGAMEAEVQVIGLGDKIAWVSLPGEIFVELGVAIKKASPFPQTIVAGLSNGSISYVPTRKAFTEGAYEVISARCEPGCGEALAEAAIRMLAKLHRETPGK